jgi:hypothetical protein
MKVQDVNRKIVTNTVDPHTYKIKNNASMFRILYDKIYTYKIAAIVREIACNAYDSHVQAGIPHVPFRVVLPNELHEYFEIEDFGLGLDEDEVYNVLTVYGETTKDQSNELIGSYGLGAKTPFAYTTSFTLQTRKNGIECIFNAYIGEGGAPTCTLLRKQNTDKGNGVKVKIPVQSDHLYKFMNECKFVLSMFSTRPEVIGNDSFLFNFTEEQLDEINSGDICVFKTGHVTSEMYRNKRIYAVMGSVCYPVNMQDISDHIDKKSHDYLREVVLEGKGDTTIFLKFEIGDLDVTASREALSLEEGKPTSLNLVNIFSDKIKTLIDFDQTQIDNCVHPSHALSYINIKYGDVINFIQDIFTYKDNNISFLSRQNIRSPYKERYVQLNGRFSYYNRISNSNMIQRSDLVNKPHIILTSKSDKTKGFVKYSRKLARDFRDKIIVATDNPWSEQKIERYSKFIGLESIYVIYIEDLKSEDKAIKKSNIISKPSTVLPRKKKTEITARSFMIRKNSTEYIKQERIDIEALESTGHTVLWTDIHSFDDKNIVKYGTKSLNLYYFNYMHNIYEKPIRIILANNVNIKSIHKNDIQSLEDFINDLVIDQKQQINLAAKLSSNFTLDSKSKVSLIDAPHINATLRAGSYLIPSDLEYLYNDALRNEQFVTGGRSGAMFYTHLLGKPTTDFYYGDDLLNKLKIDIFSQYPMIEYVISYHACGSNMDKIISEYINLVDNNMNATQTKKTA